MIAQWLPDSSNFGSPPVELVVYPGELNNSDSHNIQNVIETNNPIEKDYILPTDGTVMEAYMGECEACEEFIQEHRKLDVEMKRQEVNEQSEKVNLMKEEVKRYQKRLETEPPLLDEPTNNFSKFNASINCENSDD